jgi:hypothetical protein
MNASSISGRVACAAPTLWCVLQPVPYRSAVKLVFIAALWLAAAPSIGAGPASAPVAGTHPISGKWTWTLPGKACTETVQYRSGGKRLGTSGEEVTESEFQITPLPSLLGFYRLTETLTLTNGQRDCAGDLRTVGEEGVTRFIQFSPKLDQMIVCKEESLKACFGPLKRVPG